MGVAMVGKVKTTVQMIALVLMLYGSPKDLDLAYILGFALLYISAVLTLWSMLVYLRGAWPSVAPDTPEKDVGSQLDTHTPDTKIRAPTLRE